MQRGSRFVGHGLAGSQFDHLRLLKLTVAVIEYGHLGAHFHGQPGVFAIGAEQQMARTAAGWQLDKCRCGGSQRQVGIGLGVETVDKYLVRAQVIGEHKLAIGRRDRRMHMRRHLPLGIDPAGRMAAHLHHRLERAIGADRQHRQGSARIFGHRVIADEQMARISAET
ncbi:hypothetical protein D3C85_1209020 [compost metagenome]